MRNMNALKISRVLLTIIAALLGLAAIAYANNLLVNGGFEAGFHRQAGINGVVPNNWTVVNEVGNPTYFDNTAERIEGEHSLYIESQDIETPPLPGKPFKLDVYQKVPVISGTTYALEGLMVTFCAGTAGSPNPPCPSSYYLGKSVGLDPFGGVDPAGASVVWSPEDRRDAREARWVHLGATSLARGSSMTVFLRINSPFQFHGALGFIDGFQLAPAPVVSLASHPSVQSSTDVLFSWTGWMDPSLRNDGDYRLYYDVQVRDTTTSAWTTVASDVGALNAWSFTGLIGHTYAYRVRALAHQPQLPDCGTCAGVNHFFAGLYSVPAFVSVGVNLNVSRVLLPLVRR